MNEREQRVQVVRYWWSKAEASLNSAKREFDAGALTFAANRLYCTVFYAASAALLERELSFKKHAGVRAAFHREFVRTGLLDVEWGKFYDQIFEDRQEGDYIAFVSFDLEYIAAQLARRANFLGALRPLITSLH